MERELEQGDPTGGMTGEASGLQANNLSPRGQGQPGKKKKKKPIDQRVVMQPYKEEPAVDSRYNRFNQPQMGNQRMPGLAGAMGFNQGDADWAQQQADELNRQNPGRPQTRPQPMGVPGGWQQGQQGRNTGISGGFTPGQPQQHDQPQMASGLHDAFKQSTANGYTDIQDTNPWQTGQHMGQLQGFNTQGWGSGERGSGTLKNRFGQIASNYDVTQPGALKQLMQDPRMQEMTGGQATIVEHPNQDLIDFDGPGPMQPVDVIGNATAGGAGANWWWGPTDEGNGPQAPANQIYNNALSMPGMEQMPQGGLEGFDPQQQQGQAMQFLQWLMQQQQQGQMTNGGLGDAPMF